MGAGVARFRTEERSFQVDAGNHVGCQRVLPADDCKSCQPCGHATEIVGNDRRQGVADAVGTEFLAGPMAGVDGQVVGIEVDAVAAVELQIEVRHVERH